MCISVRISFAELCPFLLEIGVIVGKVEISTVVVREEIKIICILVINHGINVFNTRITNRTAWQSLAFVSVV